MDPQNELRMEPSNRAPPLEVAAYRATQPALPPQPWRLHPQRRNAILRRYPSGETRGRIEFYAAIAGF